MKKEFTSEWIVLVDLDYEGFMEVECNTYEECLDVETQNRDYKCYIVKQAFWHFV
jgi:hypothetical protein